MPRAAMSVATRVRTRPSRKPSRVRSRLFCDLLPWIASAAIPAAMQAAHDDVRAMLGAGEHERAVDCLAAQQLDQHGMFGRGFDMNDALRDLLDGRRGRRDRDPRRVSQHLARRVRRSRAAWSRRTTWFAGVRGVC